jgi:hypothetical protein
MVENVYANLILFVRAVSSLTKKNVIAGCLLMEEKEKKTEAEWHRTFNQESMQWSFRMGINSSAYLGGLIILGGIIIWMLGRL